MSIDTQGLHLSTLVLVDQFAAALVAKLEAAQAKYGYTNGWQRDDWMDECRAKLRAHVEKGDPLDVAAYCAFLWYHKASTSTLSALKAPVEQPAPAAAPPCAWCQRPSTGPSRNIDGEMTFTCSTQCSWLMERLRTLSRAAAACSSREQTLTAILLVIPPDPHILMPDGRSEPVEPLLRVALGLPPREGKTP